jgi:hypothetical protein
MKIKGKHRGKLTPGLTVLQVVSSAKTKGGDLEEPHPCAWKGQAALYKCTVSLLDLKIMFTASL